MTDDGMQAMRVSQCLLCLNWILPGQPIALSGADWCHAKCAEEAEGEG